MSSLFNPELISDQFQEILFFLRYFIFFDRGPVRFRFLGFPVFGLAID